VKVSLVGLAILSAILLWVSGPHDAADHPARDGAAPQAEDFRTQQRAEEQRRRLALIHATEAERHAPATRCLDALQEQMVVQASPLWSVIGVVAPAMSSQDGLFSPSFRRIRLDWEQVDVFVRTVAGHAFADPADGAQPPGIQFIVNEERAIPGFTSSPRFLVGYHCRFVDIGQVFLSRGVTISAN